MRSNNNKHSANKHIQQQTLGHVHKENGIIRIIAAYCSSYKTQNYTHRKKQQRTLTQTHKHTKSEVSPLRPETGPKHDNATYVNQPTNNKFHTYHNIPLYTIDRHCLVLSVLSSDESQRAAESLTNS